MYILSLTGGCCIHYLSNNLATRRKNVYEQLSVCYMGCLLFSVLRFDVPSSYNFELNSKEHFHCGRRTFEDWGISLEVYHGGILQF